MPAMRIAGQATRVVVIRKKRRGISAAIAYCLYRFACGLALNRGKIRALLAPTLDPLLEAKRGRAERNIERNRD